MSVLRATGWVIFTGALPLAALAAQAPRFLVVPTDTTQPPIVVDTSRLPTLRQRVALSVDGSPVSDALRSLMRASRLDFVFETRVVAGARPAALGRDSMTVASALIRLLDGAGVDVLMRSLSTIVLVPRVARVTVPLASEPAIHAERIAGRVTDSAGTALAGATVIATMAPNRDVFRTTTDSAGQFTLEVAQGTGDYLVYIASVGRRAYRKRVTRASSSDSAFVVNASLSAEVAQLAQMNVRGTRPVPTRNPDLPTDAGGDRIVEGVGGTTPPDQSGDLTVLASTVPAFALAGSAGGQNTFAFGGLTLPGAELPRDLPVEVRVSTSPFDPMVGWFSGASVSAHSRRNPFYNTITARATTNFTAAPGGASPGRGVNAGFGAFGPMDFLQHWHYAVGADAGRTYTPATTILGASAGVLADAGFARDSIVALQSALAAKSIPVGGSEARVTDAASFLVEVARNFIRDTGFVFGVAVGGNLSRTHGLGLSARATPSAAAEAASGGALLQGFVSKYLTRYHLLEARTGVGASRSSSRPAVPLPAARVLIQSDLGDGTMDAAEAVAGGADVDVRSTDRLRWQGTGDLTFALNRETRHTLKLRADMILEGTQRSAEDYGTFSFASLDALRLDAPDAYTRRIVSSPSRAGVWNGALAIRDAFRVNDDLSLMYGFRVDAARFLSSPPRYAGADQLPGVTTGTIPSGVHVSPRFGFNKRLMRVPVALLTNDRGTFRLAYSFLRGGVGEFRGMTTSETLLDAIAAAHGGTTLSCIGAAVPTPEWAAYAANAGAIPGACAAAGQATFSDAAPTIHTFASSYAPPRSWKANLNYRRRGSFYAAGLDGTWALNLDQAETVDRNLAPSPAFTTAGEGRAVYAPAVDIVPSSGAVSRSAGRIDPAFGPVLEHRSDLRSELRAVTIDVTPLKGGIPVPLQLAYTLGKLEEDLRGRGATAFGPLDVTARVRGAGDVRHRFQLLFGFPMPEGVSVTGVARFSSGRPFTPLVSSDVNGDGLANDRAFVDGSLPGFDAFVAQAPARARDCLLAQRQQPAAHNSCSGPWVASLDGRVRINRPSLAKHHVRSIDLSLTNVLSTVRGWGEPGFVDPVLYHVRGFEASSRRFTYELNPAFGRSRALARVTNPFRISLEVRMELSAPSYIQQFRTVVLRGRNGWGGRRLTRDELRARFAARIVDPYEPLLPLTDSLLLSRQQVDSLRRLQAAFRARLAPLWEELADYVLDLPESFDENAVFQHQQDVVMRGWVLAWRTVHEEMAPLLTPIQLTMLPSFWTGPIYRAAAPNPLWPTMR